MATFAGSLTYVSFPITKFEKDGDGDLIVFGKATDGSVDTDDQIVDPEWSAKALTDWHTSGGNLRVQHQARRDPAGKALGIELDRDGDGGHWVKALVVEPVAKRLVEKGVLTAYSVGIARPVIKRDPTGRARGGIVAGGELAELSLVDRPANKNCGLVLAKSQDDGSIELVEELFGEYKAADEELLTKAAPAAATGQPVKPAATPPVPAAGSDGNPADVGDTDEGSGDVEDAPGDDGVSKDADVDPDLIATADDGTRTAYKTARKEWLAREPGMKNVASGTEYLAKRAEWIRWNSEGEETGLTGTRDGAERWLSKRDFTQSERDTAAGSGTAMSDGSFPIKTGEDLSNAIHLAGHAKNPSEARAHIKRRAAALGMSSKIPDSWKTSEPDLDADDLTDLLAKTGIPAGTATTLLGYPAEKKAGPDGTVGDSPSSTFAQGGKQCATCKGEGKIMGGKRECPDCHGSGKATAKDATDAETVKVGGRTCKGCGKNYHADSSGTFCEGCGKKLPKAGKAAKAARKAQEAQATAPTGQADGSAADSVLAALEDTISKAQQAGLLTEEDAAALLTEAAQKATRPLPADTKPAGTHREPDGTTTVERLEPQAGLPTDPDKTPDKIPASTEVSSMKDGEAPYGVTRMHDALCAAYDLGDVLDLYPSLKSVTAAVDEDWFTAQVAEAANAGKAKKVTRLVPYLEAAQAVKGMDPAAVDDGRAHLHKTFTDMYPNEHITPGPGIKPGSFQRPYLTAGHASQDAGSKGGANIPRSAHTPEPEDFHRGLITDGHQAESPASKDGAGTRPPASTSTARTYYTTSARDAARNALQSMHDHIASSFPDLCPMASSKTVMPPDLGARNIPTPTHPAAPQSNINVGKAMLSINDARAELGLAPWTAPTAPELAAAPALTDKRIAKAVRKALADMAPNVGPAGPGLSGEEFRALLAEQLAPYAHRYETELQTFRKELDDLGSKPDPAMAPVRGAIAKTTSATAVPVERRSLIDEANTQVRDQALAEETAYRAYVEARTRSTDPGTREKALDVLNSLNKAASTPAA